MRRWLSTDGKYGEPPEAYAYIKAAQYLGVPVTEIETVPMWWIYKALDYMSAESEAEEIKAKSK